MRPRAYKEGQRFGRLIITKAYVKNIDGNWLHDVLCDCGNTRTVIGVSMRRKLTSSCGCLHREIVATHRMTKISEYPLWKSMTQRCRNKKNNAYKNYGARGITVCNEWLSFENFIADMGRRPSPGLTLERVDNNKGYSADNCIWADRYTQAQNKRMRADNKTGCTGVSTRPRDNKYKAIIQRNNKRVFLGAFSKLEDAIAARVKAEETFNQTGAI